MPARHTPTGDTFSVRCTECIRLVFDDIEEQHAVNLVNSHNRKYHRDQAQPVPMPAPRPKPSLAEPPKDLATEVGRVITVDISGAARAFLASLALWQHICDEEDPEAAVAIAQSLAEGDVRAHQPPF